MLPGCEILDTGCRILVDINTSAKSAVKCVKWRLNFNSYEILDSSRQRKAIKYQTNREI